MRTVKIKNLIEGLYFGFQLEDETPTRLMYATREHGDVGSETPGREDVNRALKIRKLVKEKFPEMKVDIEDVDEWIHIDIYES